MLMTMTLTTAVVVVPVIVRSRHWLKHSELMVFLPKLPWVVIILCHIYFHFIVLSYFEENSAWS